MTEKKGVIFVFSAPSGAGKTTILKFLKESIPELVYSISATTRKPRKGEIDKQHYFFMSEKEFLDRKEKNEFAEWAFVHGNYYGTPKSFIDNTINKGSHIIMDIDVFGKKQFDKVYPEAVGILILPPGLQELEKRLRGRNSDDEETILLRLENARKEMEFARKEGKYEYTIVNDNLGQTKCSVESLVKSIIQNSTGLIDKG